MRQEKRFRLLIEYDGTFFHGWQRQKGVPSVQQTIEEAIYAFCQQDVRLVCAGRTDAGVHARGQVAHMNCQTNSDTFRVQEALNAHLRGKYVAILKVEDVPDTFNARYHALSRHYMYRIIMRRPPLVLEAKRAWQIGEALDICAMREGARYLIGSHDFTSFRDSECQANSPHKTIDVIDIALHDDGLNISVSAPSFLHHQVRIIVGTLVEIGKGKRRASSIPDILLTRRREVAGMTAPAYGLYFMSVEYAD